MDNTAYSPYNELETQWLFIDEAGDPTLFNKKGQSLIGKDGCSNFFMVGKLEVEDPIALSKSLTTLRHEILADPYFAGVPSFQPERQKTAHFFHAKNDLPEVRYEVFKLLRKLENNLRFHAVIYDKEALLKREMAKRQKDPRYRYKQDAIYDALMESLFSKFHRLADKYEVYIARRGKKDRNHAIESAIKAAEREFEQKFSLSRGGDDAWNLVISDPKQLEEFMIWILGRRRGCFIPTNGR
ncbi:MAG: hypothetical protein GWP17_05715 [Aquificales bacterium]|nr:hypothetical protein [Aquificales bacterium]